MMARLLPRSAILSGALLLAGAAVFVNGVRYHPEGRPLPPPGSLAALDANPTEVRALLALAQERERVDDRQGARRALEAAAAISPQDAGALRAMAAFHAARGEPDAALATLARLMEQPAERHRIHPALVQLLGVDTLRPAWAQLAQGAPDWLGPFVAYACRNGADPASLLPLLLPGLLRGRPDAVDVDCVIGALRNAGHWDAAYQLWLETLPAAQLAEVGYVFNGGFEHPVRGTGFDWIPSRRPPRAAGHSVDLLGGSGAIGQRAIRVSYNGKRQVGAAISQFLVVPPGRYQLSGRVRLDSLQSVQGVHWVVRCASDEGRSQPPLAASEPFLGTGVWRSFAFEVSVPEDCPGQSLRLEPVGIGKGTTFLNGTAWFDDLRLQRRD